MFVLFKWFLWLCMPFTLVLLVLALVALWQLGKRRWRLGGLLLLLDAALVAMTLPATSTAIGYALERRFPEVPLAEIPQADAIVVLGGGVIGTDQQLLYPDCIAAGDRVVMAARLFHAGKAPIIIPTGTGAVTAEKPLLETMKVPAEAILCETEARDTAENASYTFTLLRKKNCKKVLLVTSAWHMPRAMMLFGAAKDLEIFPVGCDYEATCEHRMAAERDIWQKLPMLQSGGLTATYLKEWLGILFYSFKKPQE